MTRSPLLFPALKSTTVALTFSRQALGACGHQGSDTIMQTPGYFLTVGCGGRCEPDFRGQCLHPVSTTAAPGTGVTTRTAYEAPPVPSQPPSACKGRGGWPPSGGGVAQCPLAVPGSGRWRAGSTEREGSIPHPPALSPRVCTRAQLPGWGPTGGPESAAGSQKSLKNNSAKACTVSSRLPTSTRHGPGDCLLLEGKQITREPPAKPPWTGMSTPGKVWLPTACCPCMGLTGNRPPDIPAARDPCRPSRRQRRASPQGWDSMVRAVVSLRLVTFQVGEAGKVLGLEVRERDGGGRPRLPDTPVLIPCQVPGWRGTRTGGRAFAREARSRSPGTEQPRLSLSETSVLDVHPACAPNSDGNPEAFRTSGGKVGTKLNCR